MIIMTHTHTHQHIDTITHSNPVHYSFSKRMHELACACACPAVADRRALSQSIAATAVAGRRALPRPRPLISWHYYASSHTHLIVDGIAQQVIVMCQHCVLPRPRPRCSLVFGLFGSPMMLGCTYDAWLRIIVLTDDVFIVH